MTGRYSHCYQCSFIYKTMSQFFEIFSQDIRGNIPYVPEINLISKGTLKKAFYLLRKTNSKKLETKICRQKTAEDNNATTNISQNLPCTFLLFKASAFLRIFFPRNLLSQQVLRISVSLSSKCLTFFYLFISFLKKIH